MGSFQTSDGLRVSKELIDSRTRSAKQYKMAEQRKIYGYNFCEQCKNNDDKPLGAAHIISVDECQKSGRAELAWDLSNLRILGQKCHQAYDKNDTRFTKKNENG
jgi:5-methylcytosine-specific restriction endonuclease McrA